MAVFRDMPLIPVAAMSYSVLSDVATLQQKLSQKVINGVVSTLPGGTVNVGESLILSGLTEHRLCVKKGTSYESCLILEGDCFYDKTTELLLRYDSNTTYRSLLHPRTKLLSSGSENLSKVNIVTDISLTAITCTNSTFEGSFLIHNNKASALVITAGAASFSIPANTLLNLGQD